MPVHEMILFYHVVRLQSFSQAAEKLGVSKSFVSKHITHLEQALKTRLLLRNTRQVKLTEPGEIFFSQCEKLFELTQQSYERIAQFRHQPSGILKISMPPALALHRLDKLLAHYQALYPEVALNVVLESQMIDLVGQGYDLALRSAEILADSSLIARKLTTLRYVLCATPDYVKQYGSIDHPDQLAHHHFAIYSQGAPMQTMQLIRGNRQFQTRIEGRFQSNHLDLIARMVMTGHFIAVLPEFMITSQLTTKQLIPCLECYRLPDKPLYLLYPKKELMPLKVKKFIELLHAEFKV